MLLKKLQSSEFVSAHFPNALPIQRLDDLCVTHQAQVTFCGLSYEAIFFSSTTVPGETFHCAKRFTVVQEEGPSEGFFDKDPAPPPPEIQNQTVPPSNSGEPIEDGVFNASNWSEDIALLSNQEMEVDDEN